MAIKSTINLLPAPKIGPFKFTFQIIPNSVGTTHYPLSILDTHSEVLEEMRKQFSAEAQKLLI